MMSNSLHEVPSWRRKTPAELAADRAHHHRKRFNPALPAVWAMVLSAVVSVALMFPGRWLGPPPVPSKDALGIFVLSFIVLFLMLYFVQLITGRAVLEYKSRLKICTECFDIHTGDTTSCSTCGSKQLEDANLWKRNRWTARF